MPGFSNQLGFDAQIATSLEKGNVVILHSLRADSLNNDPSASWQMYLGAPQPNPMLTGGGSFAIDPAAPTLYPLSELGQRERTAGGGQDDES